MTSSKRLLLIAAALLTAGGLPSSAAELRLADRCEVGAAVVTLGDVAEVFTVDPREAAMLEAVELFPAPASGQMRYVRQREIEDLLLLRGMNTATYRFSGAGQVEIARAGQAEAGFDEATASVVRRAERLVEEAIVAHLHVHVDSEAPWKADVEIEPRLASAISLAGTRIDARGGSAPWTGPQRFEVRYDTPQGGATVAVDAHVSLPPAVVTAVRSIRKGDIVQAADVGLDAELAEEGLKNVFHAAEEVVGREATRTIAAGRLIEQDDVRAPLLVRRGQVVTVHARAAGIRVRASARARDDGSQGDLVAVESLLDRKTFFARVCGFQEVEVYARATQAEGGSSDLDRPR